MSTRPSIPQGRPPRYAMFASSRKSLRPIVITFAASTALWSLLWGAANFHDISDNRDDGFGELVPYDIALGAAFIAAALVEAFGVVAAYKQNIRLVRLYCFGAIVSSVLILGAQIVVIVADFLFKSKRYNTCFDANNGATVVVEHGWWGETRTLSAKDAKSFCDHLITKSTIADFAWLVITSILSVLFIAVNFSYYRQLLDPNFSRAPSDQVRMQAFAVPHGAYGYPQQPAYPGYQGGFGANNEPSLPVYEPSKLPGYDGSGRQTPEKDDGKTGYAPPPGPPPSQPYAPPPGPPPTASNPFERRAEEP